MIKKAAIYARYSSDNQRSESIDAQIRAIEEYAQKNGILIFDMYAKGRKYGEILEFLHKEGRKTKRGKDFSKNSLNSIFIVKRHLRFGF